MKKHDHHAEHTTEACKTIEVVYLPKKKEQKAEEYDKEEEVEEKPIEEDDPVVDSNEDAEYEEDLDVSADTEDVEESAENWTDE